MRTSEIVELWFDGACEPRNPGGIMTWAYVMRSAAFPEGGVVSAGHVETAPANTNNVAEWMALENGIAAYLSAPACPGLSLLIRGDSKLVVNQLNNSWACKAAHLADRRRRVWQMLKNVTWRAEWIPREQNAEADAAGRQAYLEFTGTPMPDQSAGFKRSA